VFAENCTGLQPQVRNIIPDYCKKASNGLFIKTVIFNIRHSVSHYLSHWLYVSE